jgi:hypothetical protein
MVAVEVSRSNDARWLGVHALVVGVGWFVVAFAGLVGLQAIDGFRHWVESLPAVMQGIGGTIVLAAAIPVAWPFFIAIGWYESGLAERIRSGDDSARRPAVRLLCAQALAFATASVLAGGVALLFRGSIGSEYVLLAWLPLALIAALHVRTATTLIR